MFDSIGEQQACPEAQFNNALQGIKDDVTKIRGEQRNMAEKQDARHEWMLERSVATEASSKSAHKRLDAIKAPRVD